MWRNCRINLWMIFGHAASIDIQVCKPFWCTVKTNPKLSLQTIIQDVSITNQKVPAWASVSAPRLCQPTLWIEVLQLIHDNNCFGCIPLFASIKHHIDNRVDSCQKYVSHQNTKGSNSTVMKICNIWWFYLQAENLAPVNKWSSLPGAL